METLPSWLWQPLRLSAALLCPLVVGWISAEALLQDGDPFSPNGLHPLQFCCLWPDQERPTWGAEGWFGLRVGSTAGAEGLQLGPLAAAGVRGGLQVPWVGAELQVGPEKLLFKRGGRVCVAMRLPCSAGVGLGLGSQGTLQSRSMGGAWPWALALLSLPGKWLPHSASPPASNCGKASGQCLHPAGAGGTHMAQEMEPAQMCFWKAASERRPRAAGKQQAALHQARGGGLSPAAWLCRLSWGESLGLALLSYTQWC